MSSRSQLISFRLKDEEVALLRQQANLEESASLTAQRLVRQLLGTNHTPPNALTSLLTQVGDFQEQLESIKGFVDEAIDERLQAVDNLINEAVNQQLEAELLSMRSRFDELEQRLDQYFKTQRKSIV